MHNQRLQSVSRSPVSTASALKQAEQVLRPLLGKQAGALSRCEQGNNAITFEFHRLSAAFKPAAGKVLSHYAHVGRDTHGEREQYWVLEVAGVLVKLSVYQQEARSGAHAVGAIYTGNDKEGALRLALAKFKQLMH